MTAPVTAVIPNWNGKRWLPRLLSDLAAQSTPPERVLVIDNGSTDGSDQGPEVIRLGANLGFAAAVNRGIEASRTPLIAILNNDLELPPGWLATILPAFEDPSVCFAAGLLVSAAQPDRVDGAFDAVTRALCPLRCGAGATLGPPWTEPRRIAMAPLTAAVFHRDVFARVGLLDERFESYLEDTDLGIRCALAGLRGAYVPTAVARHHGSASLGVWSARGVRLMARNQVFLAAKYLTGQWTFRAVWRVAAGQALWGLAALRHGRLGPWISGKREGLARAGEFGAPDPAIGAVLAESEALVRQYGRGLYWRLYFGVTWALTWAVS